MLSMKESTMRIVRFAAPIALIAGTLSFGTQAEAHDRPPPSNAVIEWNGHAGTAALAACISPGDHPLFEARLYAMTHIAIHDALNTLRRRSEPYAYDAHVHGPMSANAAVAAAARGVLVPVLGQIPAPFPATCIAAGIASVESAYAASLGSITNGTAKTRGIEVGQAAAAAILALRAGDGSDTAVVDASYPQGTHPGAYRFTPGTPFAFAPGWGQVTPFVLDSADQFKPGPPDALTSARYTTDLLEVQRLGGDGVTTPSARTAEQTQIATFWVESSPLQWNRIARIVATHARTDMWASARLFGLLNMAMADGYVATFDTKYSYNFWRPVTAIQAADTDGNPATIADPTWTPLRTTPPIPEYDSGHSVEGAVAAEVMRDFFGTDRMSFSTCSLTLDTGQTCADPTPTLRSFRRFSEAEAENGESRILVGYHFRRAVEMGLVHGRAIADQAVSEFMRLVHHH
jgi:hypothetical protein